MTMKARFPDEEPESLTFAPWSPETRAYVYDQTCEVCGQEGHQKPACPSWMPYAAAGDA